MSLLTRTTEEFSSTEYWERFFKKRGEKAFDWYGDYNKLCGAYTKGTLPICGNTFIEQLYDVGYRHLTNIDISETVVNHMNQKNAKLRPDLTFQKVDATQTPFEDGSYQATLDKGTLDAMMCQGEDVSPVRLPVVADLFVVKECQVCAMLRQRLNMGTDHRYPLVDPLPCPHRVTPATPLLYRTAPLEPRCPFAIFVGETLDLLYMSHQWEHL
uniref:eEF1A lysine and N-terminal methyltransferase n=1 Tax=Hucho hucho TaxID=62062 RepID=A0A4W5NSP1_9TELE